MGIARYAVIWSCADHPRPVARHRTGSVQSQHLGIRAMSFAWNTTTESASPTWMSVGTIVLNPAKVDKGRDIPAKETWRGQSSIGLILCLHRSLAEMSNRLEVSIAKITESISRIICRNAGA